MALLLAGQATTAYFLYQQQGRLDKLTVTSQNLQLENLRMKLPKRACPASVLTTPLPLTSENPHSRPSWAHCPRPLVWNSSPSSGSELSVPVSEYPLPWALGPYSCCAFCPYSCQAYEPDADGHSHADAGAAHGRPGGKANPRAGEGSLLRLERASAKGQGRTPGSGTAQLERGTWLLGGGTGIPGVKEEERASWGPLWEEGPALHNYKVLLISQSVSQSLLFSEPLIYR